MLNKFLFLLSLMLAVVLHEVSATENGTAENESKTINYSPEKKQFERKKVLMKPEAVVAIRGDLKEDEEAKRKAETLFELENKKKEEAENLAKKVAEEKEKKEKEEMDLAKKKAEEEEQKKKEKEAEQESEKRKKEKEEIIKKVEEEREKRERETVEMTLKKAEEEEKAGRKKREEEELARRNGGEKEEDSEKNKLKEVEDIAKKQAGDAENKKAADELQKQEKENEMMRQKMMNLLAEQENERKIRDNEEEKKKIEIRRNEILDDLRAARIFMINRRNKIREREQNMARINSVMAEIIQQQQVLFNARRQEKETEHVRSLVSRGEIPTNKQNSHWLQGF